MSFIWPWVLVSLIALPACVYLYGILQRRRSGSAARLGAMGAVAGGPGDAAGASPGRRRHIPPIILLIGVAVLALASARPQLILPLPYMEGTVVLTLDVSSSMIAGDVQPTRMEAAKLAAKTLVSNRPSGTSIGVVSFGEGGLVVRAPTDDEEELYATIDLLAPQSATSLGTGILTALELITRKIGPGPTDSALAADEGHEGGLAPAVIVLLTDGENTAPPDPLEAAQVAAERGVRVHTVGIGTAKGTTIDIDGFSLFTRMHEPLLQDIALVTEGEYFRIEDTEDFSSVYDQLETEFVLESREVEVTSAFAGAGALILIAGGMLSLFWFGRAP